MEIKKNKAHATIGLSFAMMIRPQIFPSHQKLVGTGPMNGPLLLWNLLVGFPLLGSNSKAHAKTVSASILATPTLHTPGIR